MKKLSPFIINLCFAANVFVDFDHENFSIDFNVQLDKSYDENTEEIFENDTESRKLIKRAFFNELSFRLHKMRKLNSYIISYLEKYQKDLNDYIKKLEDSFSYLEEYQKNPNDYIKKLEDAFSSNSEETAETVDEVTSDNDIPDFAYGLIDIKEAIDLFQSLSNLYNTKNFIYKEEIQNLFNSIFSISELIASTLGLPVEIQEDIYKTYHHDLKPIFECAESILEPIKKISYQYYNETPKIRFKDMYEDVVDKFFQLPQNKKLFLNLKDKDDKIYTMTYIANDLEESFSIVAITECEMLLILFSTIQNFPPILYEVFRGNPLKKFIKVNKKIIKYLDDIKKESKEILFKDIENPFSIYN